MWSDYCRIESNEEVKHICVKMKLTRRSQVIVGGIKMWATGSVPYYMTSSDCS